MFKYVLTDIDNTLLDFNKCAEKAMTDACKTCGVDFKENMPSVFHKVNDSLWQRLETGEISRDQIHKKRWNMVFSIMGIDFDGREFEKEFVKGIYDSHEPVRGAEDAVKYLSKKYILCAASNGPFEQQKHRLTLAGMIDGFSHLFVSERIGVQKPQREFFERCLNELHETDKSRFILIGDSLTADISGGKNFGITTCWYDHNGTGNDNVGADMRITDLAEIKNIL